LVFITSKGCSKGRPAKDLKTPKREDWRIIGVQLESYPLFSKTILHIFNLKIFILIFRKYENIEIFKYLNINLSLIYLLRLF
jgi:hypothetical protein